jgi:ATP-dependent Clp endopeptidase proteolytic subunit ClpP
VGQTLYQQLRERKILALKESAPATLKDFRAEAATDGGAYNIYIYDIIDDWFGVMASDIVMALADAGGSDVVVHVNSPGGMVSEGLAIFNTFRAYGGNVEFRVEGFAASAASVVVMSGNKVVMEPGSMMMVHEAWGGAIGTAEELRSQADLLDKLSDNMAGIYANKAGKTAAYWMEQMSQNGGDGTWYNAQEAVDAGLADEVGGSSSQAGEGSAAAKVTSSIFAQVLAPQNRVAATAATVNNKQDEEPPLDWAGFLQGLKGVQA